jgi:phosphohistidine phosphatase
METWDLVSKELELIPEVEVREDLYHATPGTLVGILQSLPPELGSILLVGHNPTFEDLALSLAGQGPVDAMSEMRRKYPTGALAVIDFSVESWAEVRYSTGTLREFVRPRDLP